MASFWERIGIATQEAFERLAEGYTDIFLTKERLKILNKYAPQFRDAALPPEPQPQYTPPPTSPQVNYLPFILIGGGILLVIALSKKK
ncbi:MAG: hypothetical protein GXO21_05375 [Aquificae bacterium]|nr:hypothetical protein [Aquificota bacterium]